MVERLKELAGSNWASAIVSSMLTILGSVIVMAGAGVFNSTQQTMQTTLIVQRLESRFAELEKKLDARENEMQEEKKKSAVADAKLEGKIDSFAAQHGIIMTDIYRLRDIIERRSLPGGK